MIRFRQGPRNTGVLGSSQEVLGNLLRMGTSPDSLGRQQSLVLSSGEKNPNLGVDLSVALTPTLMTLGNIKSSLIMFSPSSREKEKRTEQQ